MAEPQIRYTKTHDGVSIAYYAIGRGPVLVYMPPMPMTHLELEWKVDDLREAHENAARASTFIRYDGRGFGLSDRSATDFSLEAMVSDLEAVVDAAAPGRPLGLMAAEHMAIPALVYAARHPERVGALVLWLGVSRGEDLFGGRMNTMIDLARSDWEFLKESLSHTVGFDSASANRAFEQLSTEAVTQESYIAFMEAMRSWDATDVLDQVSNPALVLARREFRFIPVEAMRRLAAALPNGELVTLEGAATAATTPDVGEAIRAFFARLFVAQARPQPAEAVASGSAVILFTDIVDSTALTERLGDARFREASRTLDAGLRAAIRDAGGAAIDGKLLGDGVLATFPSAAQAIDGARRCLALSAASELGLHIGLHAGDVIREENNVFGGAVNIASRICGLSAAGEILVSDVVRGMARSSAGVTFEDRGEQEMKGVSEPVRVYAVRGLP
ncbi:MAG TPA: adenylate/guanylate cyclase domain-containing protein [Dehalococcoidia bacterium]